MGPGTEPRTNSKLRSASTFTTRRPSSVKFRAPMCPGIRFPLMMRDGSVPGAIEPGFRCRVLPWVSGPPPKWWRCTTPWNPRPLVTPVIFTRSPGLKMVTVTESPGRGASPTTSKLFRVWGAASRPAFLACASAALVARFAFRAPNPSWARSPATCTTAQGPASITVTGMCEPSSSKTRVMPSFLPISPFIAPQSLNLDLHIHSSGQIQLGERVHGLGPGVQDVDEPLVRLQLELLPALLVDVRAPQHRPQLPLGGQGDGPRHLGAGLFGRAHDVRRGLIDQGVVERFETDANFAGHGNSLLLDLGDDAGAHGAPAFPDRKP